MRRFAIGDIHGCSKALRTLLEVIDPQPEDELIFLGDYIDRGSDSRDVVDQIIALKKRCRVVTLRGNHEIMLVAVALKGMDETVWLENGGQATVASYGGTISRIPPEHMNFYRSLKSYYETDDAIFVHAGYCHLVLVNLIFIFSVQYGIGYAHLADSALSFKDSYFEVRLRFGFVTVSDAPACNQQPRSNNNHDPSRGNKANKKVYLVFVFSQERGSRSMHRETMLL